MNKIFCKTCRHGYVGSVLEETGQNNQKMPSQWIRLKWMPQSSTQNSEFWLEKKNLYTGKLWENVNAACN